jgi:NAD(P)H-dependent FMN reductase
MGCALAEMLERDRTLRAGLSGSEIKIIGISGSLRSRSSNTEALKAAALVPPASVTVTVYDGLADLPAFNPDLDTPGAMVPASVQDFRARIGAADAVFICSPEYAHGVPGSLKNALDWLVSSSEMLFKPIGLLNVSPRSTHAYASLAETLRTMSTVIVEDASIELPLSENRLDAAAIAARAEFAEPLRRAIAALCEAAQEYRVRRDELRAMAGEVSPAATVPR